MGTSPADHQATFCATLVDEWVRCGVLHAVVSPGSRSTPLALAIVGDPRLQVHVHHDERSAGFLALGLALTTREPTIVLTTSGTGAVELHPAVVEADLAAVALLVCTADRPPELLDVGAPQAIDQTHLFGRSVRWFHAPGVADEAAASSWRPLAARSYAEAAGPRPGPVHLNLAFREPLLGTVGALPPGRTVTGASWAWRPPAQPPADPVLTVGDDLAGRRGLFVAGAGATQGQLLHEVASALGWPVVAAPQAGVWSVPGATIPGADALLRTPLADDLRPEVVVHLGGPLASRVVGEWVAAAGAAEIVVAGTTWTDPHGTASVVLPAEPDHLLESWASELTGVHPAHDGSWLQAWVDAGQRAQAAIDAELASSVGVTEPGVAGAVLRALPPAGQVVVSSSMPIRDLEWYVVPTAALTVHANRGANGIDGVVSTAVGVAVGSGAPTALVIGDVAFLHDSNGLLGAAERGIDLVVVVIDNDGGGIFSFLPQGAALEPDVFEQLFGTPHGVDVVAMAEAYGVPATATDDVGRAVADALSTGGVHVVVARTDRAENLALHRRLNAAVAAALAPDPG